MFTGIIEEIGEILAVQRNADSMILTIKAEKILDDIQVGDSVATNGVCLTVVGIAGSSFQADVMHETMRRSALGKLKIGSRVNLERAMRADARFGGHMVSGHIDGTGSITDIRKDDNAVWYTIAAQPHILHYIIEKGSIAIDGISLTVAAVSKEDFSVSIIPHTLQQTTLARRRTGDLVNLENDMVGKYIEKFLTEGVQGGAQKDTGHIDKNFLARNGFI
ncbi:MAG: riboflavin synthase [Lachnospiraceae bacterium]|nr:riboflavin synthase [Lachnospiraceae bacterium]